MEKSVAGLARDPRDGHWSVLAADGTAVYELSPEGTVLQRRDTRGLELVGPRGLVWAPSPDLTDGADVWHLFILDSGLQEHPAQPVNPLLFPLRLFLPWVAGGSATEASSQTLLAWQRGRLIEAVPASMAGGSVRASLITVSLVRTVDLSTLSPPSPDSAGLAYISTSNTLLVSDSEVEETVAGITHF
ncbi:hypothetical protein RY27_15170, partial [Litorilinea aerophila]